MVRGWEGHYELVKLNLRNPAVAEYLFGCIRGWVEEFGVDGLRWMWLLSGRGFRAPSARLYRRPEAAFVLIGEMLHGDYKRMVNGAMLHSATNYECYKGLYSSFNSMNLFEIGHSLARQFGPEAWTLYKGLPLLSFADNHDVTRVATILTNKEHLWPLYGVLFGMPGVPCVYYGSEWGMEGGKEDGDAALRPRGGHAAEKRADGVYCPAGGGARGSRALCHGATARCC